jgi:dienelactone hydrolase
MTSRIAWAVLLSLLVGPPASAQAPAGQRASGPPPPAQPSAWQHPTGPYGVVMEEDGTLPNHTVYRPESLAAFPGKDRLPIVAFSGPGCDFNGTAFRPFFTEVASHGFLVIANGPPEPKGGSGRGFPRTTSADHLASVDWAARENGRKESRYYQRIDASKIAVMGQSCGGLQTLDISQDPRITTLVLWNSGVLNAPTGAPSMPVRTTTNKEVLKTLRVPIAYFVGKTDMANPNAMDDFQRIDSVPVFLGSLDIPGDAHAGTFRETNGGKFGLAGVAWLKWQLKKDEDAAKMFRGPQCGLCQDTQWEVRKKQIDLAAPAAAQPRAPAQPPPVAPTGPGTGPYPAISEVDPGLPTHTVFRPANLEAIGGVRLPVLAWANGGCANSPRGFEPFLAEVASHGFLVIAIGTTPPQQGQTSYKRLAQAIDWAAAQNGQAGGKYRGKIDTSKVAVAGQSCGGLQAIEASFDPRVTTTLVCNSGVLNTSSGAPNMPVNTSKDMLAKLHTPMFYMIGGPKDIAYPNATDDFARIEKVPAVMMNLDVGHGGTYREANGGEFGKAAVAWLRWQLKGEQAAKKMFTGADCGFCSGSAWKVEVKNLK